VKYFTGKLCSASRHLSGGLNLPFIYLINYLNIKEKDWIFRSPERIEFELKQSPGLGHFT